MSSLKKLKCLKRYLCTVVKSHSNPIHKTGLIDVNEEVRYGLLNNKPLVALESTILTHGMRYPHNLETALEVENIIRNQGALPVTIAVLKGRIKVGLSNEDFQTLCKNQENCLKVSRRDIPYVTSKKLNGGTTVSGTMLIAHKIGIPVFVTGGVGGVHRNGEKTMDVSADLTELGRTPVAVISSGIKSILDIGRTLEYLETQGVAVATYGSTENFPAFYTRKSGFKAPYTLKAPKEAAEFIQAIFDLNLNSGALIAVPIPESYSFDETEIEQAISEGIEESKKNNITGKDVTPFLLERISLITKGQSLQSNIALIKNNASIGAQISVELFNLRRQNNCLRNLDQKDNSNSKISFGNDEQRPVEGESFQVVVAGGSNLDHVINLAHSDIKIRKCLQETDQGKESNSDEGKRTTQAKTPRINDTSLQMTVMLLQNNVCVYSNNNNNASKGGPSTIEDQYRQHFNKNETNLNGSRQRLNVFSLQHSGSTKREGKAMNYYRLWIYTCNAVLFISVIGFIIVAGKVVVVDPRREQIRKQCSRLLAMKMDGRLLPGKLSRSGGGVARNIADALGKLGTNPFLISGVGNDIFGAHIIENTLSHINLNGIVKMDNVSTGICYVICDSSGECKILIGDMDIHDELKISHFKNHEEVILSSSLLVMDGNLPTETINYLLDLCRVNDVPVWFEPTDIVKATKAFHSEEGNHPNFVSPNYCELREILKVVRPSCPDDKSVIDQAKILAEIVENVIVTLGKDGVLICRNRGENDSFFNVGLNSRPKYCKTKGTVTCKVYKPDLILKKEVVNVSGAGDCFASGFITQMLKGESEESCVRFGFQCSLASLQSLTPVPESFSFSNFRARKHLS